MISLSVLVSDDEPIEGDSGPAPEIARMPAVHEIYDAAIHLKDAGDLAGAVAKLHEVLAIDPAHTDTHSALAVYNQRLGKFDDAIAHAQKVVELLPNEAFSYTQMSVIYIDRKSVV